MRDLQFDILARDRTQEAFRTAEASARRFNTVLDNTQRFMNLAALGAKAFGIGIGIETVERLGRAMLEAVKHAADLGDMAERIGIPVEDMQKLMRGFQEAGVPAEKIEQALTQWSLKIGEAYTQGGRLNQILRANGVSLTESDGRLRSSVSLMRDYAELVRNAGSEQERLVLAQGAGWQSVTEMTLALKGGAAAVDQILSLPTAEIIADAEVRKMQEVDQKLESAWNWLTKIAGAGLRGVGVMAAQKVDEVERWYGIGQGVYQAGRQAVQDPVGAYLGAQGAIPYDYAALKRLIDEKLALERALRLNRGLAEKERSAGLPADQELAAEIADAERKLAELERRLASFEADALAAQNRIRERDRIAAEFDRKWPGKRADDLDIGPRKTTVIPSGDESGPARLDPWNDLREVDNERVKVLELIASMEEELRLVNATDAAKRASAISRRAGAAATEEERNKIIQLNETLFQEQRAQREARKEREFGRELAGGFFGDLASAGDDFWENFERAGLRVGERIAARWQDRVLDQMFGTGDFAGQGGASIVEAIFGRRAKAESAGAGGALDLGRRVFDAVAAPARDVGMSVYREAIASIESLGSGGYGAIGPTHPTLGRALGRYGVMEANVGPWSQAALGRSISVEEFMASPGLQDRIFDHRFGGYVGRYGPQGAASMWFSGRPDIPNVSDVLGTSTPAYVRKFNAAIEKATGGLSGFGDGLGKFGDALSRFPGAPAAAAGGGGLFSQLLSGIIGPALSPAAWGVVSSGGMTGLFADGGWPAGRVHGPGGGRDDGMLAWFSSGEFIVERQAAMEFADVLEAINGGASPREVARRAARRDPWLARHALGGWAGRNAALQRVVDSEGGGLGRGSTLPASAPPQVLVGEIGVSVDDDGRVQAYVKKMGIEAAKMGAKMGARQAAMDLPKVQAAWRTHGGV